MRKIWDGQDITVIKGADNEKFTHDIYDNAKSVSYIYGPKEHAFREYDRIFAEARQLPKDRLIIIVLGRRPNFWLMTSTNSATARLTWDIWPKPMNG